VDENGEKVWAEKKRGGKRREFADGMKRRGTCSGMKKGIACGEERGKSILFSI
jgi:hypothetical protein